jgi:hypothetical protein
MSALYSEDIISGLGLFKLQVDSTSELVETESIDSTIIIRSTGYHLLLKQTEAPTDWLPTGMSVDMAKAWLFYITKSNATEEQLTISFKLLRQASSIHSGADTGERLTAIEFEDGIRQLHIGTQDEEWFAGYGKQQALPERLVPALNKQELLITDIEKDGLKTKVPVLFAGEQFYVHYILAEGPRRKSAQYPDNWDISTWYTVDQSQQALERAWREQAEMQS